MKTENKFDPTKPVQTRDGRKAQILYTNRNASDYPIVAMVTRQPNQPEDVNFYTADGRYYVEERTSIDDLVNIPEKWTVKFWVNVYASSNCADFLEIVLHGLRANADEHAGASRIACLEFTREYTVGEGLEEGK